MSKKFPFAYELINNHIEFQLIAIFSTRSYKYTRSKCLRPHVFFHFSFIEVVHNIRFQRAYEEKNKYMMRFALFPPYLLNCVTTATHFQTKIVSDKHCTLFSTKCLCLSLNFFAMALSHIDSD